MNVLMGVIFLLDSIHLFAFIHKVVLYRRAPGSVPIRARKIPTQDKKTQPRMPLSALLLSQVSLPSPSTLTCFECHVGTRVSKLA